MKNEEKVPTFSIKCKANMRHYASVASPTHSIIVGQKNKNKNNVGKPSLPNNKLWGPFMQIPGLGAFIIEMSSY